MLRKLFGIFMFFAGLITLPFGVFLWILGAIVANGGNKTIIIREK